MWPTRERMIGIPEKDAIRYSPREPISVLLSMYRRRQVSDR